MKQLASLKTFYLSEIDKMEIRKEKLKNELKNINMFLNSDDIYILPGFNRYLFKKSTNELLNKHTGHIMKGFLNNIGVKYYQLYTDQRTGKTIREKTILELIEKKT